MLTPEQAESVREQLLEQIEKLPEEQKGNLREQVQTANPGQLESFIKQSSGGEECLFCGIGKGTVDTVKVYEDTGIVAFLDITPAAPGQVIIIPKEHYQFIFQVPDMVLWDMARIMKALMPIIVNVTKCQGISVYIAQGPAAGQRVGHVAINLIPRFEKDKAMFVWERKDANKEDLEKSAKEIKHSMEKTFAEERDKIVRKVREEIALNPKQQFSGQEVQAKEIPEAPRRRA